jgi:hypothetical protein
MQEEMLRPRRTFRAIVVYAAALWAAFQPPAAAVLIDFEDLEDLEQITVQYLAEGVLFSNAQALVSGAEGGSLNEIDFPPRSGITVSTHTFSDTQALPVILNFTSPIDTFSGYFTYHDFAEENALLVLSAYSPLNEPLGSVQSSSSSNLGSHEQLGFSNVGLIARIEVSGGDEGTFTMDDVSFELGDATGGPVVPEPSSFVLLGTGIGGIVIRRWRMRRSRTR